MKNGIFSRKGLVTIVSVIFLTMPTLALGASLSLISEASYEDARFNPPPLPFAPYDPNNPNFSIEGQIEGLIGVVLDWLGVSPVGSIYGPGISSWDNYVGFMDRNMYAQASAVGTVASFADVFLIGDTQYVKDTWYWAAIYELNGDPGETAEVRLDYKHDYTFYNLAIAGRSRATTDVLYGAYIIPAAKTGAYSQDAAHNWGYRGNFNNPPADASFRNSFSLHDGAQYTYLGGFREATRHKTGSFDLSSMSVGDRLYVYGYLGAYTECMMYHPPTLSVATMFPSFLGTLFINDGTLEVGPSGYPYTSIQAAINAAGPGDTVLVHDGTYMENINFLGKAITVKSVNGAARTIINANGSGRGVTFNHNEGSGSVLDGFTITNGFAAGAAGGGIQCVSSSPTIANCIIIGNRAGFYGGGISCESSSSPTITNCLINGNTAFLGGGIFCKDSSSPTVTNCTISGNTGTAHSGGIGCDVGCSPIITNCIISGNTAGSGGGIYSYLSSPIIVNCTISGNTATNGGGIYCEPSSSSSVKNTILWGNVPNEIYLAGESSITVTYSDVDQNGYAGIHGNIRLAPLFVDPANGDFRLQPTSPCIDAGTSDGAPLTDMAGNPRFDPPGIPNTGGGTYPYYDMGALEYAAPVISLAPASKDFGNVNVDSTASQVFTISNVGTTALAVTLIELTGPDAAMFSFEPGGTNPCPSLPPTIVSGGDCSLVVRFKPVSEGAKTAALRIASNDPSSPIDVPLTGAGALVSIFNDCPETQWAEDYINSIYYAGITVGCAAGMYCPGNNVTREQMAAFIVRAVAGEPPSDYCDTGISFSDVQTTSVFCKYIKKLVELGITQGCAAGMYCPTDNVLRQQMAAFIVRAVEGEPLADYCNTGIGFTDVETASVFCKYIKRLVELGVTQGCAAGKYCPLDDVLRDQMAAFLARAFLGMQ
jgi:parallel beta-helix repeat protein